MQLCINFNMSLQQLAICVHLNNILTGKQEPFTDLELKFKTKFKTVADSAIFPEDHVYESHQEYKITYSKNFLAFFKILKLVLAEYSLLAPDCTNIKFQDVPAIMQVIDNFDTNYHRMIRPHTNLIPTL